MHVILLLRVLSQDPVRATNPALGTLSLSADVTTRPQATRPASAPAPSQSPGGSHSLMLLPLPPDRRRTAPSSSRYTRPACLRHVHDASCPPAEHAGRDFLPGPAPNGRQDRNCHSRRVSTVRSVHTCFPRTSRHERLRRSAISAAPINPSPAGSGICST